MNGAPSEGRFRIIDRERKLFVGLHARALRTRGQDHTRSRGATALCSSAREIDVPRLVVASHTRRPGADVQRLPGALLIRRRVGDEEDLRLHDSGNSDSEGARTNRREDLRSDVLREETRGLWPYWRAATTRMFSGLNRARNSPPPDAGVVLLDVQNRGVDPDFVDERLHVGAFLLRADVHAGRQVHVLGRAVPGRRPALLPASCAAWTCSSIRMSSLSFRFARRRPRPS